MLSSIFEGKGNALHICVNYLLILVSSHSYFCCHVHIHLGSLYVEYISMPVRYKQLLGFASALGRRPPSFKSIELWPVSYEEQSC